MKFFYVLENVLFPPAITILFVLGGLWFYKKDSKKLAGTLIVTGVGILYVLSLPIVSNVLSGYLEQYPPLDTGDCSLTTSAQAIVVLAFTRDENGLEYGGPMSSGEEMERLRYAAYLYHCLKLPVFVVGGDALDTGIREADLMRHTLEKYFHVPVAGGDGRSRHTWDNASYTKEVLGKNAYILLVTHAWHMKRAVYLFEALGIKVQPAPTAFTSYNPIEKGIYAFIPSASRLRHNKRLAHELVGLALNIEDFLRLIRNN